MKTKPGTSFAPTSGATDLPEARRANVDAIMEQAQVFASAWSLVGGRFDNGDGLEDAEAMRSELRDIVVAALAAGQARAAQQPAPSPAPATQQEALFDAHGFRDWVLRNMPDDTIIGSSAYWADHLTAWAKRFVKAAPTAQADSQPAHQWDVGYPPLPEPDIVVCIDGQAQIFTGQGVVGDLYFTADQMRAYIDSDRAARAPADTPIGGEWRIGELDGNWLEIDHKDHPGVLRIVWKMEDDKRTPKCEERAFAVLRALNAAPADSVLEDAVLMALNAAPADSVLEDAARLDWLEQNLFHREKDEWDTKFGGYADYNMWVLFSPKGIQGRARDIIDAARKQGGE